MLYSENIFADLRRKNSKTGEIGCVGKADRFYSCFALFKSQKSWFSFKKILIFIYFRCDPTGKVKVKFTLEQATKAQIWSRCNSTKAQIWSRCNSTLPSTLALDGGWVVNTRPRPLYPRQRPGTHFIGAGWDPTCLEGYRKSHLHRDPIPGPSSR